MKIRFLLALVGLSIGIAVPAFAQQKDTVDPQLRQRLVALLKNYTDAMNNNDAAALAALYMEDVRSEDGVVLFMTPTTGINTSMATIRGF